MRIEAAKERDATRKRRGKPAREVEILEYDMEYAIAKVFFNRYLDETKQEILDSGNQISDKAEYQSWSERTAQAYGTMSEVRLGRVICKGQECVADRSRTAGTCLPFPPHRKTSELLCRLPGRASHGGHHLNPE